jgi:hypothetical protein
MFSTASGNLQQLRSLKNRGRTWLVIKPADNRLQRMGANAPPLQPKR